MDKFNKLFQKPEESQPPEAEEPQEPRRPGAEIYEWLQLFLGCVVAAVVLFNCVARLTRVDGGSMDNTLQHGEVMLIWSLGYTPAQGDIVVLNKTSVILPGWSEPRAIVKRVIAVGGQTVDIDYASGAVYVDGQPLEEPYLPEEMYLPAGPSMQGTHWEVPQGSVFVMGDNRNHSADSRFPAIGIVDVRCVIGHGIFVMFPFHHWKGLG